MQCNGIFESEEKNDLTAHAFKTPSRSDISFSVEIQKTYLLGCYFRLEACAVGQSMALAPRTIAGEGQSSVPTKCIIQSCVNFVD